MDVVLLDSDVFSFLSKRGHRIGALYVRHVQGKSLAITFVSIGELYAGVERGIQKKGWSQRALADLEQSLKSVAIIPYDDEICKVYGRLRATLKTPSGSDRGHP